MFYLPFVKGKNIFVRDIAQVGDALRSSSMNVFGLKEVELFIEGDCHCRVAKHKP